MKFNIRRITLDAVLTAAALTIFIIELQIPALVPVPGVKLGLANIITLFALHCVKVSDAAAILLSRIILGSIFTGQLVSMIYSLAGGTLCFAVMLLSKKITTSKQIWICSVLGAIAHNIGQIMTAVLIMGSFSILFYFPMLILSGIISGLFTGFAAQYTIGRMKVVLKTQKEGLYRV